MLLPTNCQANEVDYKPSAKSKVYVFVGVFQGVVDTVDVYCNFKGARNAFTEYTGISYTYFEKQLKENSDLCLEEVLGENFSEYKICIQMGM